jgi:hypothetical protein
MMMFEKPEIRRKRWLYIGIGTILGGIIGFITGRVPTGAFLGYIGGLIAGLVKFGVTKPETLEQKKQMRLTMWALSTTIFLGTITYAMIGGDFISAIGAGIGLTLSIGVSFNSLYDERVERIFSKSARNAYITLAFTISLVGFMDEAVLIALPEVMQLLGTNPLMSLLWVSYLAFGITWIYHGHIIGE